MKKHTYIHTGLGKIKFAFLKKYIYLNVSCVVIGHTEQAEAFRKQ